MSDGGSSTLTLRHNSAYCEKFSEIGIRNFVMNARRLDRENVRRHDPDNDGRGN